MLLTQISHLLSGTFPAFVWVQVSEYYSRIWRPVDQDSELDYLLSWVLVWLSVPATGFVYR